MSVAHKASEIPLTSSEEHSAVPVALGDVFLRVSEDSWYIRWNGQSAYVGTKDGRKQGALLGLELLEKLLSSPNWEGSPTQLLSLGGGGGSSVDAFGVFGVEGDEGVNPGFGTTTLGSDNTSRLVVRYIQSAEALIARQLPAFADYLKTTVLPPSRGAAVWSYETRRWNGDYDTRWTFGHIDEFIPPKRDSSNIFRRESPTRWHIRFGSHECHVPHSDGMDMLSVLLLHPTGMSAERICMEMGLGTIGTAAISGKIERSSVELGELGRRAKEFKFEMALTSENAFRRSDLAYHYTDDDYDEPYQIPETVPELIEALKPIPERLATAAKNSHAAAALHSQGIPHSYSEQIKGTFEELVAKMKRCQTLLRDLHDFDEVQRAAATETLQDRGNPALKRRVSLAIRKAITEITQQNQHIGAYFKLNFRIDNMLLFIKIATHWRVSYIPECDLFHKG
jgi:hypothetical protein